jgi:NADH:ubiquinone oxidoreductase subunit 6 (subunit J)
MGNIGIIVFAGAIALTFMTAIAAPNAKHARSAGRRAQSFLWYSVGVLPIALVCTMWARTGDQPWWALAPVLAIVGAVLGACILLTVGYWVYPTAAQTPPPIARDAPPHDDTFVGSAPPGLAQGSDNTVVNDADLNGNVIHNKTEAIGSHACAGANSVAIGSHAGAGACPKRD